MKKKTLLVLLIIVSLFSGGSFVVRAQAPLSVDAPKLTEVVPGVLYITLKAHHGIDFEHLSPTHTGNTELDKLFSAIGVTDIYPFDPDAKNNVISRRHGIDRIYVINFSDEGRSPRLIGHDFQNLDVVEGIGPRYVFQKSYVPNDPSISSQYALDKMQVKNAWGISKGNANIIIADLDEGVNYDHEDLAANIYQINGHPGVDLVGSGSKPSTTPVDFDPMPGPNLSHGTFTTGCFGEVPDNNKGGAGTGFNCKIMAVKIADDAGKLLGGYEGIYYGSTHGAKILNCSWGGYETDPSYIAYFQVFIDDAVDRGSLVVAAAGNDSKDIDAAANHFIPAYLNKVLSVGATDENDKAASFSNYGKAAEVFAPGANIYSTTFPGNDAYSTSSGTSFACPLTSGIAGLVWAKNPDWTPKFVARQIIETCDNVVNPGNRGKYWGRVNAFSALTKQTVPGIKMTDFVVDGVDSGGLDYINKIYSLDVKFKNYMAAAGSGNNIQVRLLPIDGYTVQLGTVSLGAMNSLQTSTGSFKFTRDGSDNGAQLPMLFAVTYGSSTVEALKYYDTLSLTVDITGDNIYVPKGVKEPQSEILGLGNTYPNPVSSDGTIMFELAKQGYAKLSVSDVLGRTLNILSAGNFDSGTHRTHFDVRALENGVYLYKLETVDGSVMTKRMIVIH